MWIVFDDHNYRPYGPFNSRQEAENWLEQQEIIEPYGDQEISLFELLDPTITKLPVIS